MMSTKSQILSILECQCCKHIFESPIVLPCSFTICRKHIADYKLNTVLNNSIKCPICHKVHQIPIGGFPKNHSVQSFIDLKLDELDLEKFKLRSEAKMYCGKLKQKIDEFESIRKSPLLYIMEFVETEVKKINTKREEELKRVDEYYSEMVSDIRSFEKACIESIQNMTYSKENLETIKKDVEIYDKFLNTLTIDEAKWKIIKKEMIKNQPRIENILKDFKSSALMNQIYQFEPDQIVI
jgi:hypothetical protein